MNNNYIFTKLDDNFFNIFNSINKESLISNKSILLDSTDVDSITNINPVTITPKMYNILIDIFSLEYIQDLIYGNIRRINTLSPILELLNIYIQPNCIMTIMYDDFWTTFEYEDNSFRYLAKRKLLDSIRKAIIDFNLSALSATLIGTDKVVLILNCDDIDTVNYNINQYLLNTANKLKNYLCKETKLSVSIGISKFFTDRNYAKNAYEESFKALENIFKVGKSNVFTYNPNYPTYSKFSIKDIKSFNMKGFVHDVIISLNSLNNQYLEKAINNFLYEICHANFSLSYSKTLYILLISESINYIMSINIQTNQLSKLLVDTINDIFKLETLNEINMLTIDTLTSIINILNDEDKNINTFILGKAYIDKYYMLDITLDKISYICGYSSTYFSRTFKKLFNISFSKYLLEVRINNSKYLLTKTNESILTISENVGFNNFTYFCSSFKNIEGITPTQYRNSH